MLGGLMNEFFALYDRILPTVTGIFRADINLCFEMDKWTEHERRLLNGAIIQSQKAVNDCGDETAGLEGDEKSIVSWDCSQIATWTLESKDALWPERSVH